MIIIIMLYKTITKTELNKIMDQEEYIEMSLNNFNDLLYLIELNNFNIKSFKFYIKKEDVKELVV
jgi:hypothetical protein